MPKMLPWDRDKPCGDGGGRQHPGGGNKPVTRAAAAAGSLKEIAHLHPVAAKGPERKRHHSLRLGSGGEHLAVARGVPVEVVKEAPTLEITPCLPAKGKILCDVRVKRVG